MASQINVGMDLGSYKTAVMTSEGRRAVMPTVVGHPKDGIARRLLKTDTVFGDAAIYNRHSLEIIRPLAFGRLKFVPSDVLDTHEQDVARIQLESLEKIVEHAFSLVGVQRGTAAAAMIGVPAVASSESKDLIVQVAEKVCHSVMVVSEPFAVAYGLDCLHNSLVIDIGAGTTDICALTGVFPPPEHQQTLTMGGDAIDAELFKLLLAQYPTAICSPEMLRNLKERHGSLAEGISQVELTVVIEGKPIILNVAQQLRQACQSLVEPVFNGITKCLSIWDSETQDRLLRNVILAGGGSRMGGLDGVLERRLQDYYGLARVSCVDDPVFSGAAGALKLAMEMPSEHWTMVRKAA